MRIRPPLQAILPQPQIAMPEAKTTGVIMPAAVPLVLPRFLLPRKACPHAKQPSTAPPARLLDPKPPKNVPPLHLLAPAAQEENAPEAPWRKKRRL